MKNKYEVIESDFGVKVIKRIDEQGFETWIPCDSANSDYQAYLASLDEQQAALEAK